MTTETAQPSSLNALSAAQEPERVCDHCRRAYTPRRGWSKFCSSTCRAGHHALQRRAPALFEALRRIAAGEADPQAIAAAATKGLKAP